MTDLTRRSHLKGLIGAAALGGIPTTALAATKSDKPVPP